MGTTVRTRIDRLAAALLLLAIGLLGSAAGARGADELPCRITEAAATVQQLTLIAGQSRIIVYATEVETVTVGDPEIANYIRLSPTQLYLLGRKPGRTNMTFVCENGAVTLYEITVASDVAQFAVDLAKLKEKLHEFFPDETGIQVRTSGMGVVLSGSVSSTPVLSQVLAIAEPYFKDKIINLLSVSGVQQVMLEVRIAEMSRSTARELGINLAMLGSSGTQIGLAMLGGVTSAGINGIDAVTTGNAAANARVMFPQNGNNFDLFIKALQSNGLANVLAEPNLITISGQRASFLSGGKFPYDTTAADGTPTTTWANFGVELAFTPTVLAGNRIGIVVNPKVSSIGSPITVSGKTTSTILSREVNTTIELGDGQSFAIAGLLQNDIQEAVDRFPVLGSIPILGALFRSSKFQKRETELIVIATPHLVRPLNAAKQPLPTDSYVEPGDFEFYLMGSLASERAPAKPGTTPAPVKAQGGLEGEFGHIVPE